MKIITALAVLTLSSPAYALSLTDAMNELAGMTCSGSTCTSRQSGSVTVDNPDITTLVSPATSDARPYADTTDHNKPGFWNEKCQTISYVNEDCTPQALNQGSGGFPAVYSTTDGGTTTTPTCTTTTKELAYNGPNTSRDTAWSITTSESTSDGGC